MGSVTITFIYGRICYQHTKHVAIMDECLWTFRQARQYEYCMTIWIVQAIMTACHDYRWIIRSLRPLHPYTVRYAVISLVKMAVWPYLGNNIAQIWPLSSLDNDVPLILFLPLYCRCNMKVNRSTIPPLKCISDPKGLLWIMEESLHTFFVVRCLINIYTRSLKQLGAVILPGILTHFFSM